MSRVGVAVLGATGAVGQRFVELLADHPWFEIRAVAASDRNAGLAYRDATTWILDRPVPASAARMRLTATDDIAAAGVEAVFSALPGGTAGPVEAGLARQGLAVFTNARDHRMDADVPLLIPEVNPDHLDLVRRQPGPGFVVANGNCSAIVLTLALAPLHRAFGLDEVHVTTLQGLSGAGYPGVSGLDIVDNVLPYIEGEEDKLETEPQKTLGELDGDGVRPAAFRVHATATRVPVREGHLESVHVRLTRPSDAAAVRAAWTGFRAPADVAALPGAPPTPVVLADGDDRPQPRRDRDAGRGMSVTVGRVRLDPDRRGLRFVALGHNTVRGAAGQSVLNAEAARARGLLGGASLRAGGNV